MLKRFITQGAGRWVVLVNIIIIAGLFAIYSDFNFHTSERGYTFTRIPNDCGIGVRSYRINNPNSPFDGEVITINNRNGINFIGEFYGFWIRGHNPTNFDLSIIWFDTESTDGRSVAYLENLRRHDFERINEYFTDETEYILAVAIMNTSVARGMSGWLNVFYIGAAVVLITTLIWRTKGRKK
ncbi:MAG: hypothetical protein FWE33_02235 [Defluviitaleaceae bacterium]|nr:hypothetical protein [Defluviitaleaceae bacterium]